MLKLLATTSENFNAVEWIAIILILAISIIMMFLLHLIAIDSTQRLYINLLILTIVAVNIIIFYMIDSISVKIIRKRTGTFKDPRAIQSPIYRECKSAI